jgi:hypothetical protein
LGEQEAFWVLVQLMKEPRYNFQAVYRRGMVLLTTLFEKLSKLLAEVAPKLHSHLQQEEIPANTFAMKWFLTLFSCKVDTESAAAIMDVFLEHGWNAILHIAAAYLILAEGAISI